MWIGIWTIQSHFNFCNHMLRMIIRSLVTGDSFPIGSKSFATSRTTVRFGAELVQVESSTMNLNWSELGSHVTPNTECISASQNSTGFPTRKSSGFIAAMTFLSFEAHFFNGKPPVDINSDVCLYNSIASRTIGSRDHVIDIKIRLNNFGGHQVFFFTFN